MANLYPTLEDLKVHQIQEAQVTAFRQAEQQRTAQGQGSPAQAPGQQDQSSFSTNQNQAWYPSGHVTPTIGHVGMPPSASAVPPIGQQQGQPQQQHQEVDLARIYPSLMQEYMGLRLEPPTGPLTFARHEPGSVSMGPRSSAVTPMTSWSTSASGQMVVAPLTQGDLGAKRGQVSNFIREVFCCKDDKGRFGLRLKDVDKGIFVQFVEKGSPASMSGLRFGDQILQVNGQNMAGVTSDQAFKLLAKINSPRVSFIVRDRPFERSVTLHKDSQGHVGFTHDDGLIKAIVKDSSAARNGLLVDHYVLEVNGQNVVGLKSKQLAEIISQAGQIITLTIIPRHIYEHIMKCMSTTLVKQLMDRSIPEIY